MTSYKVEFAPEVKSQLRELGDYIAMDSGSVIVAKRYVEAVVKTCMNLSMFPHRCIRRDDILPGLRLGNHKGRTVIAYVIDDDTETVSVVGIFHGGQDYEALL